jgi:YfiH family protein
LRQVHGDRAVVVAGPGQHAGDEADASVSHHPGAALAILTADCAPIALASPEGVIGAVHAGWRGLLSGVVEVAAAAMAELGATRVEAALGPCIHAECYEFSPADLDAVAAVLGDGVRGVTTSGQPALDVPGAVGVVLERAGVALVHDEAICTACSPDHYSHRARGEIERQATVVWLP